MSFPQELMNKKQWVCWRYEPDPNGGKPKKMPINPKTGKGAMSNNPDTWSDYQTAFNATTKFDYTGIGYMSWWYRNRNNDNGESVYCFTCEYCGKKFCVYGNNHRKYCSQDCFHKARVGGRNDK